MAQTSFPHLFHISIGIIYSFLILESLLSYSYSIIVATVSSPIVTISISVQTNVHPQFLIEESANYTYNFIMVN